MKQNVWEKMVVQKSQSGKIVWILKHCNQITTFKKSDFSVYFESLVLSIIK